MTRRPLLFTGPMVQAILDGRKTQTRRLVKLPIIDRNGTGCELGASELSERDMQYCPYGAPGDRLWVREAFAVDECGLYHFIKADWEHIKPELRWKPSIHMRREESRITLEIVSVHVERVQDISDDDVWAEGAGQLPGMSAQETYAILWESINGAKSWQLNPWVWKITFTKL